MPPMTSTEPKGNPNGEDMSSSGGSNSVDPDMDTSMQGKGRNYSPEDRQSKEEEQFKIAERESKIIWMLKLLAVSILILSTCGVAVAVYTYTNRSEVREFTSTYTDHVTKVLEAVGSGLAVSLGAVDAFCVATASHAVFSNSSWPFVTLPNFAVRGSKLRSLSKSFVVSQYHLVSNAQKEAWQDYTAANDAWVEEGLEVQKRDDTFQGTLVTNYTTTKYIYEQGGGLAPATNEFYMPKWQSAPVVPFYPPYNWDAFSLDILKPALNQVLSTGKVVISEAYNLWDLSDPAQKAVAEGTANWIRDYLSPDENPTEPASDFYYPVFEHSEALVEMTAEEQKSDRVVAVFALSIFWRQLIQDVLPPGSNGVVVVFGNECNQSFTYEIHGAQSVYLGKGDLHDPEYNHMERRAWFSDLGLFLSTNRAYTGAHLDRDFCPYWLRVYPSDRMKEKYTSKKPIIFTVVAVCIFLFTSIVFLLYDFLVEQRQAKVLSTAMQSNAIVSSLFPSVVRDRLFPAAIGANQGESLEAPKSRLKTFLNDGTAFTSKKGGKPDDQDSKYGGSDQVTSMSRPIADLFPETTVLFADIAGFTAWSSVREPTQVFILLETLYCAFDAIARRRGVFKVETIGDSYVAVCGLPEPRKDHAVVMAKFALDCRVKMNELTRKLEVTLGPDTGDLAMRFGLHSGPVTAGVLRGEKSRFQLFGDTVNTAARMESTGKRDRIQVTQSTADLLTADGKSHWLQQRENLVEAKGKGQLVTFWVEPSSPAPTSQTVSVRGEAVPVEVYQEEVDDRSKRLVEWNCDVLGRLVKQIVSRREAAVRANRKMRASGDKTKIPQFKVEGLTVLDEVKEIIELPEFDPSIHRSQNNPDSFQLNAAVEDQLRQLVSQIGAMYRQNPFHNFEHASHVTMSVVKLLSRIVAPESILTESALAASHTKLASTLHDHTYGITSDPLTQFACVFAALIHDVDHPGVPNAQLVKEQSPLATMYKGKSIAEQNSVDLSWDLFMNDTLSELRNAICGTDTDLIRFRQLVVNAVMATDIMDKDLKALRNMRWDRAFSENGTSATGNESPRDATNRKATIVIEHLIQASDIAHTMQHWHIYRKWNERLFMELCQAYEAGRAETHPAEFWYKGEIGFFDFYIIPLAKKLRDCGVFGVSSDEYLDHAMNNRLEWERRGQEVVATMVENMNSKKTSV